MCVCARAGECLSHPTRVPRVYKSLTSQTLSGFQILWEATCTLPAFTKPEHRNEVGCVGWPVEEAGAEPLGGKMLIWTFSSFVTSLTRQWDVCMLCKHSTQVHRCTQINNKKKLAGRRVLPYHYPHPRSRLESHKMKLPFLPYL